MEDQQEDPLRHASDAPPPQVDYQLIQTIAATVMQAMREVPRSEGQKDIKLADPTALKKKDLATYENFVQDLEARFEINPHSFSTDKRKILAATSWINDDAKTRWRQHNNEDENEPTWEDFKKFLRLWVDPEADRNPRYADRLLRERQGKRTVTEWAQRCRDIWRLLGDPTFQTQLWIATLREEIKYDIARLENQPRTLEEAEERAILSESRIQRESRETQQTTSRPATDRGRLENRVTAPASGAKRRRASNEKEHPSSKPSDKPHKVNRGPATSHEPWDKEKMKQFQENRCFKCNEVGHQSRSCPRRGQGKAS